MNKTITRLKKVNGQINWIIKMIEEKQDCEKIIIQFQAAKSALEWAFWQALNNNLEKCLANKDPELTSKIIKLIAKF